MESETEKLLRDFTLRNQQLYDENAELKRKMVLCDTVHYFWSEQLKDEALKIVELEKWKDAYRKVAQKFYHEYGNSDYGSVTGNDAFEYCDNAAQRLVDEGKEKK